VDEGTYLNDNEHDEVVIVKLFLMMGALIFCLKAVTRTDDP
jgi:hypothetical protein